MCACGMAMMAGSPERLHGLRLSLVCATWHSIASPKCQAAVPLLLFMLVVHCHRLPARKGLSSVRAKHQVAVQAARMGPSGALITGTGSQHGIGRGLLRAFLQVRCCGELCMRVSPAPQQAALCRLGTPCVGWTTSRTAAQRLMQSCRSTGRGTLCWSATSVSPSRCTS